jgi:hypothetical protein
MASGESRARLVVGSVSDFSTEKKARAEAVRLGLIEQINRPSVQSVRLHRKILCSNHPLGWRHKAQSLHNEIYGGPDHQEAHLLPCWNGVLVFEMKAFAIEKWLKAVSVDTLGEKRQEWDSLTK